MKLVIIFVVVVSLVGLLSAQPVDSSAFNQLVEQENSGIQRVKRLARLGNCPRNHARLNRKCVHCDVYENIMEQDCPGRLKYKGLKRHYIF